MRPVASFRAEVLDEFRRANASAIGLGADRLIGATNVHVRFVASMTRNPIACLAVFLGVEAAWALDPGEVLILVNKDLAVSSETARMYQRLRGVPPENTLRLSLGTSRNLDRGQYRSRLALPVKQYLLDHPAIQCLLTTAGVPYLIVPTPGREDGASVDSELAGVLQDEPADWNGPQPNPFYLHDRNLAGAGDPRQFQMVFVSRLDGPDNGLIRRIVEDAVTTEARGLEGPVYGDSMGLDGNIDSAAMDTAIRGAVDRLSGAGFAAGLDLNPEDWRQPASGPGNQAAGAAFYVGWYNLRNFQDIFGREGLARGSIAWHVASNEAVDLWDVNSRQWCINLLRRGAAVTLGPAFEPYVSEFPKPDLFVEILLTGRTVAESYWLSLPGYSWAMVLIGDPLYRPFKKVPRPSLVVRGYAAANPSRVLHSGEAGSLILNLQCVGPPGASTPAMTAEAEPGRGLAAASGSIAIPALHAGESVAVRVPSVTAGSDPTGMFRLDLNVQGNGRRRIVLEGRTGFALVNGGIFRQSQLFISPNGEYVISGFPGSSWLTETATLQTRSVSLPQGTGLANAAFAPDASHVVLTAISPSRKTVSFVLADSRMQKLEELPAGHQFVRWLENAVVLLVRENHLVEYNIETRTSLPVWGPPGWTVNSVIPRTAIQILTGPGGRFAVRDGAGPVHEVLKDVPAGPSRAVANDLSQFGALDDRKRLWLQAGFQAAPHVVAEDVEQVLWGPVSRRLLVTGKDRLARVYDGANGSWTSLGPIVAAQWSPDEERLLYLEAERRENRLVARYLTLLSGHTSTRICDVARIGNIGGLAFTKSGDAAFVLAGPGSGPQVWMVALPAR